MKNGSNQQKSCFGICSDTPPGPRTRHPAEPCRPDNRRSACTRGSPSTPCRHGDPSRSGDRASHRATPPDLRRSLQKAGGRIVWIDEKLEKLARLHGESAFPLFEIWTCIGTWRKERVQPISTLINLPLGTAKLRSTLCSLIFTQ